MVYPLQVPHLLRLLLRDMVDVLETYKGISEIVSGFIF